MSDDLKKLVGKFPKQAESGAEAPTPKRKDFGKAKGKEVITIELTDEEKEELLELAKTQVAEKYRKVAKKRFLEEMVKQVEQESIPEQQLHPLLIDLAGHANKVVVDGKHYIHGRVYYLTQNEYDSMTEIMSNTWRHEREVHGANGDFYRKPQNALLRPGHEQMSLSQLVNV